MASQTIQVQSESIRYAARQPILTATQKVIGYKLFFRSTVREHTGNDSLQDSFDALLDVSSLVGIHTLCDRRLSFLACSHQSLVERHLMLLPPERAVAELPRSMPVTDDVLSACRHLKQAGYRLAIECVTLDDPREPLFEFADFLKVNIHRTEPAEVELLALRHRNKRSRLLADHVETWDDFQFARSRGFQYFQGLFFRKPEKMRVAGIASSRAVGIQLLSSILKPDLDWFEIEAIMKRDPALYYRLLRFLNSAAFGIQSEVRSIRQALTILGEDAFRRWCRLAVLLGAAQNRPSDLTLSALIRARFAELIGQHLRSSDTDFFLLGLLSLMDAILEIPMSDVLDGVALSSEMRSALIDHQGSLSLLYDLILAVEAGAWGATVRLCEALHLDGELVADASFQAIEWAQSILTSP